MELDGSSILTLANLFRSSADVEQPCAQSITQPSFTRASIGPVKIKERNIGNGTQNAKGPSFTGSKDIWAEEEVDFDDAVEIDPRSQPEHNIRYRQHISTQDVYLGGTTGKTPSIHDADDLVVSILLPNSQLKDIDLDVNSSTLEVRSPKYRLKLPLPEEVDDARGNAKWDKGRSALIVTLPIKRNM